MKKIILSLLLICIGLIANTDIQKIDIDACLDTTKYPNKSFKEMKELIISKIQDEAFSKFYKDKTSKDYSNKLTQELRNELSVEVNNMYDKEKNFCNKATVSINEEKLNYYLPQKISLDRICHKDENLSPAKLKEKAEEKAYKEIISQISKKNLTDEQAKSLVHNYTSANGQMYMAKGAYCLSASGEVVPFEVEQFGKTKQTNSLIETELNSNTQVIKNKMYMTIQKINGDKKELEINYTNHGINIPNDGLQYIKNALNNDSLSIKFKTRLLIPNEIKANTVTVSFNGKVNYNGSDYNYSSYINGNKIEKTTQDIKVINVNGQRYLNLDVNMNINKGYYQYLTKYLLPEFNTFSFNLNSNSKITPIIVKSNQVMPMYVTEINGKSIEFSIPYNNEGFNLTQKQLTYIKNALNNNSLSIKFKTRLLIPSEIKANTVTVSFNGKVNYNGSDYNYSSYINGNKIERTTQDIKVINANGQRYLNLDINMNINKGYYQYLTRYLLPNFNTFGFIVSNDMGDKWYGLNNNINLKPDSIPMIIIKNTSNNQKELNTFFDGTGINIPNDGLQYIKNALNNDSLSIKFKTRLLIPNEIKANTVTVSFNGKVNYNGSDYNYSSYINGNKIERTTQDIKVINANGQRYLNLDINMNINKGYYQYLTRYLLPNFNTFGFIVSNNMGDKWYGLLSNKATILILDDKSNFTNNSNNAEKAEPILYQEIQETSEESKNRTTLNNEIHNTLESSYVLEKNKVILTVKSKNLVNDGRGGISISFPQFSDTSRIINTEKIGFDNVALYKKGTKIWNREIKKSVRSSYLLTEGWSTKWKSNEEKIIKLTIDSKNLDNLEIHVRSNIINGKKEYVNPINSSFYNQQGYYDKVLNLSLK